MKRCKDCDKPLREYNKSEICSNCQKGSVLKAKYNMLLEDFERHKVISSKIYLEMYNKLKKYEDLDWYGDDIFININKKGVKK